ncbi:MAG TPA: hypothetical protein VMV25_06670 [Steroidobacteraceae bacterium]|nr:hypothetical protein [Steroidobacteraceae bacterium]
MSAAALLHEYLPHGDLAARPNAWWQGVLGIIGFATPPRLDRDDVPIGACGTPGIGVAATLCEVWRSADAPPCARSQDPAAQGPVTHKSSAGVTFGAVAIEEGALRRCGGSESAALREATEIAYRAMFETLDACGHPHLVRVWHYLPQINRQVDGDERYRHFNSARRAAFARSGRARADCAPAATAVGSIAGSPLTIHFLAALKPPIMIENPRQVSAYRYPSRYGRDSPLFSRACLLRDAPGTNLFISGTASIVGHESIHRGDAAAQTRESLANIAVLLEEADRHAACGRHRFADLRLKVYLRRPADFEAVRREIELHALRAESIVYLQADICRDDLLVEIEANGCASIR